MLDQRPELLALMDFCADVYQVARDGNVGEKAYLNYVYQLWPAEDERTARKKLAEYRRKQQEKE